jgi:hypothetical protein
MLWQALIARSHEALNAIKDKKKILQTLSAEEVLCLIELLS